MKLCDIVYITEEAMQFFPRACRAGGVSRVGQQRADAVTSVLEMVLQNSGACACRALNGTAFLYACAEISNEHVGVWYVWRSRRKTVSLRHSHSLTETPQTF